MFTRAGFLSAWTVATVWCCAVAQAQTAPPIAEGDRVVTKVAADIKRGNETLLEVEEGTVATPCAHSAGGVETAGGITAAHESWCPLSGAAVGPADWALSI